MTTLHLSIVTGVGIAIVLVLGFVLAPILTSRPTGLRFTNNPLENVEDNCGQFYTITEKQHDSYTVPVLLMNSNATGCFKLTFTVADTNYTDPAYLLGALREELNFRIGNYNVTTNGHSFGIAPGKDHTGSFEIFHMSQTVDSTPASHPIDDNPINYPTGTTFTQTALIKALPNANGFYDYSIPGPNCTHFPLAVGYSADQVNSSDFSRVNPLGQTCESLPFKLVTVQVAGMGYKELQLQPIPFK